MDKVTEWPQMEMLSNHVNPILKYGYSVVEIPQALPIFEIIFNHLMDRGC